MTAIRGGADWLVLDAVRAGHQSLASIAVYARVEPAWARQALNRLRRQRQVRMYGDKRGARYVAVKAPKRQVKKSRAA